MLRRFPLLVTLAGISCCGAGALAHDGHEHESPNACYLAANLRTWTHVSGRYQVHGSFVAMHGEQVQVRKPDGELLDIKLDALSRPDRVWVEDRVADIRRVNDGESLLLAQGRTLRPAPDAQGPRPSILTFFKPFDATLKFRWDNQFFYVESTGLPDHPMMVGITAWQQQVPLPQPYSGNNAWQIPLHPVPAQRPISAKDHFFRGAIALAVNGVPIFNPIKNDGRTDTFLAGELDEYGGHCGRADDYHYHIAPVHLESKTGKGEPLALALDGYPIYGYDEPDGSKVQRLDAFNGHQDEQGHYHYHATKAYPYLNGGFHGVVTERGGQVDPQPRSEPVRPDTRPLRGATITSFLSPKAGSYSLMYELRGRQYSVNYTITADGAVTFRFVDSEGRTRTETYRRRDRGPGRPGGPDGDRGEGRRRRPGRESPPPPDDPRPSLHPDMAEVDREGNSRLLAEAITEVEPPPQGQERNRGQRQRNQGNGQGRGNMRQTDLSQPPPFHTQVPVHPVDVILGRPTDRSVTLSIISYTGAEGTVLYGAARDKLRQHSKIFKLTARSPVEMILTPLEPDTEYHYRLDLKTETSGDAVPGATSCFHTQRAFGKPFTFTIQADSHLDLGMEPECYALTLKNALSDRPDFHVDLGDSFMTDKFARYTDAITQYFAQRYYLGQLCRSAPLFFVLGNHDGESGSRRGGTAENMPVWSVRTRKQFFPNPYPDAFYSGNHTEEPFAGKLGDYYAWHWGDALFVVLDPFWYTTARRTRGGDSWGWTLGEAQYRWLKKTLETSQARFKFVFIHHLVGGATPEARGGAEAAQFFEWGGHDLDGSWTFTKRRPGWDRPIHQLLVDNGVSAVFHGHDHFYARQVLDGIVYQLVPQPGNVQYGTPRSAREYGYREGNLMNGPGYLRVAVSPQRVVVSYVLSVLSNETRRDRKNGQVIAEYAIPIRGGEASLLR